MTASLLFTDQFKTGDLYTAVLQGATPLDLKLLDSIAFVDLRGEKCQNRFTLEEAWTIDKGVIVLLGKQSHNPGHLAKQITQLALGKNDRVLWIADPNCPKAHWTSTVFTLPLTDGVRVLKKTVGLSLTNEAASFQMKFGKGARFELDAPQGRILCQAADEPNGFGRDGSFLPISADGMTLDLAQPSGAAFAFEFEIPGGPELVRWLDRLRLGIWYGYNDAEGEPAALRYPVLEDHPEHAALKASARITPIRLNDTAVSHIEACPIGGGTALFVSFFLSVLGRKILLESQHGGFTLLFVETAAHTWGLGLAGRFRLVISDQRMRIPTDPLAELRPEETQLACGSAGTESIQIGPDVKDALYADFVPGQPGFVIGSDTDTAALDGRVSTSWLRIFSPCAELPYLAQPDGEGALFSGQGDGVEDAIPLLPYLPMTAARLGPGDAAPVLPIVPLAGLERESQVVGLRLENTAIATERKAIVDALQIEFAARGGSLSALPQDLELLEDVPFTAITPRGLEAHFTRLEAGGERWDSVQIARLTGFLPGNSGNMRFAGAAGIVEPLKSALLTNQQFMVVSDPDAIRPFFSGDDAKIVLRDWQFLLDPDTWAENGTILILKNAAAPVQELIEDTGAWTMGDVFNKNVTVTSRRLQKIAQEARDSLQENMARRAAILGKDEDPGKLDMEFFVNTVLDSSDWNGFLFLHAGIGEFPKDLEGMKAGFRPGGLFAHHLGVTQTPFTTVKELDKKSSSMFGLIRYNDTRPPPNDGYNYDFRVRELGVLFQNSDIRDFRAFVTLSIGRVFGQRGRLAGGDGAVSEMEGVRHLRGDGDAYTFTAVNPITLEMGNGPLKEVHLEQGEFVTNSVERGPDGMTRTSFRFAGSLSFDVVKSGDEAFDVFSFSALAFSDLTIQMDFPTDHPDKVTYTFSIEDMQLDEALSKARDESLFEGFPIKIDRLVESTGAPDALGNMTVQPPDPPKRLPKTFYGVMLLLDMGTLSDVAGAAGVEGKLLLAWGPSEGQYYIGLNISGAGLSGLGNDLSLLGVLKLATTAITLRQSEGAWVFMMHGMRLGVFGKALPPDGSFEFYIFGNPDPTGSSNSLGWYGAYLSDEKEKKAPKDVRDLRALAAASPPLLERSPRLRFRGLPTSTGESK